MSNASLFRVKREENLAFNSIKSSYLFQTHPQISADGETDYDASTTLQRPVYNNMSISLQLDQLNLRQIRHISK